MGKRARIIPWIAAGLMWTASEAAASGGLRWISASQDRLLNGATICITVWALLSHYATAPRLSRRVSEHEKRLDAFDRAWGSVHEQAERARQRSQIRLVGDSRRRAG